MSNLRGVKFPRFATLCLVAMCLVPMLPAAAQGAETTESDEEWAAKNCEDPVSLGEQGLVMCVAYEYKQADAKLNALYKRLKTLEPPLAWKQLVIEEKAWIKERDETCQREVRPDGGGEDDGLGTAHLLDSGAMNECLRQRTEERVKTFEEMIAGLAKQAKPTSQEPQQTLAGGWSAWMCPTGVAPDPEKCANFGIFLYDRHGQLCGAHTFATANATRLDEGLAPSIIGKMNGLQADVIVQSGRSDPPVRLRIRMILEKDRMHWKMVGMEPSQGGSDEYLIPEDLWLARDHDPVFSKEFASELEAACQSPSPSLDGTASGEVGTPSK